MCSVAGLPEKVLDHFRLAVSVGLAVSSQVHCEPAFQAAVPRRLERMSAQEIPQVNVIEVRRAPRHHRVQVPGRCWRRAASSRLATGWISAPPHSRSGFSARVFRCSTGNGRTGSRSQCQSCLQALTREASSPKQRRPSLTVSPQSSAPDPPFGSVDAVQQDPS